MANSKGVAISILTPSFISNPSLNYAIMASHPKMTLNFRFYPKDSLKGSEFRLGEGHGLFTPIASLYSLIVASSWWICSFKYLRQYKGFLFISGIFHYFFTPGKLDSTLGFSLRLFD